MEEIKQILADWSIAHVPTAIKPASECESECALAADVATELCRSALHTISHHRKEIATCREVFISSLRTLAITQLAKNVQVLLDLKAQASALGETRMLFGVCFSLLSFRETRAEAMREILSLDLDKDQQIDRDFMLEGMLAQEESCLVSVEDLKGIIALIKERDLSFSTKKMERSIRGLMKHLESEF
ncbi:MAG: hypothetical protein EOP84_22865 [Verrucomicrobiaceae bacterium]|nr:MAG: hypothetical protein EOP84_22865 [Verrucomicrobiaceae bacterium]